MAMHVPWDRSGVRSYLLAVGLIAGHITPISCARGLPFLLAGIALHVWAKGCLHQEKEVTTSGPYRFVRHPFYLANAVLDVGIIVMSGWWLLAIVGPIWWLAVYIPVIRREERIMTGLFGGAYAEYRSLVPMLVPYRRPLPRGTADARFSWRNPNVSVELPRALRSLSYPLIFLASFHIRTQGRHVSALLTSVWDILLLVTFVALHATVWMLKRARRETRKLEREAMALIIPASAA
jgi:hypothetical protein